MDSSALFESIYQTAAWAIWRNKFQEDILARKSKELHECGLNWIVKQVTSDLVTEALRVTFSRDGNLFDEHADVMSLECRKHENLRNLFFGKQPTELFD